MFYKSPQKQQLLSVHNDLYAQLINFSSQNGINTYTFDFTYEVPITEIFKNNAFAVKITVMSKLLTYSKLTSLTSGLQGSQQNNEIIKQLNKQIPNIRNVQKQQNEYVVTSKNSDITAYINNSIVNELKQQKNVSNIQTLTTKKLVNKQIQEFNDKKIPIMNITSYQGESSNNFKQNQQKNMMNMILYDNLDPSYIVSMEHRSITANQTTSGLLRPKRSLSYSTDVSYDSASQLLNSYVYSVNDKKSYSTDVKNDSLVIQSFESTTKTTYQITERLIFNDVSFKNDNNMNLTVKFELMNNLNGLRMNQVTRQLNLEKHITNYFIPIIPPTVNVIKTPSLSKVNLEIIRRDDKTCKVRILQKTINTTSPTINDYEIFGEFNISSTNLTIPINVPINSYLLYRVIPIGTNNVLSHEYTNVIVAPDKFYELQNTTLSTQIIETGIQIEARNFSNNVAAIQILVKNKTTHESNWRSVGNVILLTDLIKQNNVVTITDTSVKHKRIYEYVVKLIFNNGLSSIVGNSIIEFIKQESGIVDTKLTNLQIVRENNNLNVIFNIKTQLFDTNLNILQNLLKIDEISNFFASDIEKEKSLFKKLVAHNVVRSNLTTGEKESFGVIIGDTFNDNLLRKQNAVKDLQSNNSYRYEVYPLIRSPETLLENYSKEVIDSTTKKPYKYSPIKFQHPITLTRGVLLSEQGRKLLYPQNEISHGIIGNLQTISVSFELPKINLSEIVVSKIDIQTNKLQWSVEGELSQIDHFLILKDSLGIRTFIGKCHSDFEENEIFFMHKLTKNDCGSFKYVVIPIFNTYIVGLPLESKMIEVEI